MCWYLYVLILYIEYHIYLVCNKSKNKGSSFLLPYTILLLSPLSLPFTARLFESVSAFFVSTLIAYTPSSRSGLGSVHAQTAGWWAQRCQIHCHMSWCCPVLILLEHSTLTWFFWNVLLPLLLWCCFLAIPTSLSIPVACLQITFSWWFYLELCLISDLTTMTSSTLGVDVVQVLASRPSFSPWKDKVLTLGCLPESS